MWLGAIFLPGAVVIPADFDSFLVCPVLFSVSLCAL